MTGGGEAKGSLPRSFYEADPRDVAPALLNKLLVGRGRAGRIVEVEAYLGSEDPASHAFRGRTRRNATMFGSAGRLYVYFTYGMHFCANAVCGPEEVGHAVLLRALAPVWGIELMQASRPPGTSHRQLTSGPAKLCQAFGIGRTDDGADLVTGDKDLVIADDGLSPPQRPGNSGRVGVAKAADVPWRWWLQGDANVSRGR
ncbi:MAG TPA: DNA-3-methyladenine glycosylase [Acidimicrobiales bacterium]|nr:DNA-3-methyladenine glycosylase [Acidimicrobiales bacterium]